MTADDLRALSKVARITSDPVHLLPDEVDALADLIDACREVERCPLCCPQPHSFNRSTRHIEAMRSALAALDQEADA